MSNKKDPIAVIQEVAVTGGLKAYIAGLQKAASFIGAAADDVAEDTRQDDEAMKRVKKYSGDEAVAIARVLGDLNDKVMAQIKASQVAIDDFAKEV